MEEGWLLVCLDEARGGRSDSQRRAIFAKMKGTGKKAPKGDSVKALASEIKGLSAYGTSAILQKLNRRGFKIEATRENHQKINRLLKRDYTNANHRSPFGM